MARASVSKIENAGANARGPCPSSSIVRVRTSRSVGRRTACNERPAATSCPARRAATSRAKPPLPQSIGQQRLHHRQERATLFAPHQAQSRARRRPPVGVPCSTKRARERRQQLRRRRSRRPTMPKSWKQIRPSVITNRLPGCGSPMEQAVLEELCHVAVDEAARAGLALGRADGVDAHTAAGMNHHGRRAQAVNHIRDVASTASRAGDRRAARSDLARQVHLRPQVAGDLVNDRHEAPAPQRVEYGLRATVATRVQDAHVGLDRLSGPRPADLDDNLGATGRRSGVGSAPRRLRPVAPGQACEELRAGAPNAIRRPTAPAPDGNAPVILQPRQACCAVCQRVSACSGAEAKLDECGAQPCRRAAAFGHRDGRRNASAPRCQPHHSTKPAGQTDPERARTATSVAAAVRADAAFGINPRDVAAGRPYAEMLSTVSAQDALTASRMH